MIITSNGKPRAAANGIKLIIDENFNRKNIQERNS